MIELRPFAELGRFDTDWLEAHHHFSFGHYVDPERMGLGTLRVWNDDTIQPGTGFDRHGHRDMEIITYVREGAITHEDHLGNQGRTEAGDVQVMSAGKGIIHAEYNREQSVTRIFQIWIEPAERRLRPRWEQRRFPQYDRAGELVPLASGRPGDDEALPIHQDAAILGATLMSGQRITHRLGRDRKGYLVPATGRILVNGKPVDARDGVAVWDEDALEVTAEADSEILLADVP
ncbi:pirin family protein [Ferruginivarius sediminum]|uniref:Pirin family protein n=1 Tax=Ferruginivarius sediminum TaxID=2661937 RepID=A0A369TBT0_9PROT|nr:pirin family protein [Ferruginivarius sediminum]RDD62769.1 pirin family protein [Ferruginivarius sediminum]